MTVPILTARPTMILRLEDAYMARLGIQAGVPLAFGWVRVFVTARHKPNHNLPVPFPEPIAINLVTNPSGVRIFFNEVTGRDGIARAPYFGPGKYDLMVESQFYRPTAVAEAVFVDSPKNLTLQAAQTQADGDQPQPIIVPLEPGSPYPFPGGRLPNGAAGETLLRGAVIAARGSQAGYQVDIRQRRDVPPYRTGPDGQWLLVFPDDQKDARVTVQIEGPDGRTRRFNNVQINAGKTSAAPNYVVGAGDGGP